jgi:hypothetical protein
MREAWFALGFNTGIRESGAGWTPGRFPPSVCTINFSSMMKQLFSVVIAIVYSTGLNAHSSRAPLTRAKQYGQQRRGCYSFKA